MNSVSACESSCASCDGREEEEWNEVLLDKRDADDDREGRMDQMMKDVRELQRRQEFWYVAQAKLCNYGSTLLVLGAAAVLSPCSSFECCNVCDVGLILLEGLCVVFILVFDYYWQFLPLLAISLVLVWGHVRMGSAQWH